MIPCDHCISLWQIDVHLLSLWQSQLCRGGSHWYVNCCHPGSLDPSISGNQLFWQFEHVLLLTEHNISNRNQETHQQTRIIFKRTNSHVGDLMANESLRINLGSKLWKSYPVIGPPEKIDMTITFVNRRFVSPAIKHIIIRIIVWSRCFLGFD